MNMNTHEYAVVTDLTLSTYRYSGFEAGNVFNIQSRTEDREGEDVINLICPDGLIRGYQERFFDIKEAYRITPEEMASKRITAALWELYECLPDENREAGDQAISDGLDSVTLADELGEHMGHFIADCTVELYRIVEKRTEQLRDCGPIEEN